MKEFCHGQTVTIGMCFFHKVAAVKEHSDILPMGKVDMARVVRDIQIVASFPPELFERALLAMLHEWTRRRWDELVKYFEKTWGREIPDGVSATSEKRLPEPTTG